VRLRHSVYVVELDRDVLNEHRFRQANPGYDGHSPCVYVGMTGLAPEERFRNHKLGHKGNRFVELYGLRLLPQVYACFNPMPYRGAQAMERELAQDLRDRGWAVWQA
jgi:hypothetical protein